VPEYAKRLAQSARRTAGGVQPPSRIASLGAGSGVHGPDGGRLDGSDQGEGSVAVVKNATSPTSVAAICNDRASHSHSHHPLQATPKKSSNLHSPAKRLQHFGSVDSPTEPTASSMARTTKFTDHGDQWTQSESHEICRVTSDNSPRDCHRIGPLSSSVTPLSFESIIDPLLVSP